MTSKEFNRKVKSICLLHGGEITDMGYEMATPFGKIRINCDPSPRIKLYHVSMRFLEDFEMKFFYKYFSEHENINKYSKKWNILNEDPQYVLDELDERLDNLGYILKRDGKVCGKEYKPII